MSGGVIDGLALLSPQKFNSTPWEISHFILEIHLIYIRSKYISRESDMNLEMSSTYSQSSSGESSVPKQKLVVHFLHHAEVRSFLYHNFSSRTNKITGRAQINVPQRQRNPGSEIDATGRVTVSGIRARKWKTYKTYHQYPHLSYDPNSADCFHLFQRHADHHACYPRVAKSGCRAEWNRQNSTTIEGLCWFERLCQGRWP